MPRRDAGEDRWRKHVVTEEEAGRTVREILTGPLALSGRMIQRLTRTRGVRLNRRPAYLERAVRKGDVVAARVATAEEPGLEPVAMELDVVHEDAEVLVVNKPPFLLVHPVAPHHTRTLAHGLAHHLLSEGVHAKVRPVHRLDRDTSGLVLVAKSAFAHQFLDRALREREMRREYLAFVGGVVEEDAGEIDAPIGRHPRAPQLRAVTERGEPARTRWRVVERFRDATLLDVELETGRTHQIRVHLAHLGHPVLGDSQYGGRMVPGLARQALHAWRLSFPHPASRERLTFEAPLPPDLAALRERLIAE
ncbi:MAG TPA: RluA family pseudouridine synthase [Longimicrobiaceae bacterium]|nr:RluA family pseudouridine synthase [Longimicrobiaceae bacterium]